MSVCGVCINTAVHSFSPYWCFLPSNCSTKNVEHSSVEGGADTLYPWNENKKS
jgi:hypothetical protein